MLLKCLIYKIGVVSIEIKEKHQHSNTTVEISQCNFFRWIITYLYATEMFIYKFGVVTIEVKEKHQHSNTTVEISQCNFFGLIITYLYATEMFILQIWSSNHWNKRKTLTFKYFFVNNPMQFLWMYYNLSLCYWNVHLQILSGNHRS